MTVKWFSKMCVCLCACVQNVNNQGISVKGLELFTVPFFSMFQFGSFSNTQLRRQVQEGPLASGTPDGQEHLSSAPPAPHSTWRHLLHNVVSPGSLPPPLLLSALGFPFQVGAAGAQCAAQLGQGQQVGAGLSSPG